MTKEKQEEFRLELLLFAYRCYLDLAVFTKTVPPSVLALAELAERLHDSFKPRIAFAGRFSAGKTTLVNSILGSRILKEGLSETTAIPTRIRYGESVKLFLKRTSGEFYEATESEMQEFMSLSASEIRSELLKRYLEEQEEAVLEHPQVTTTVVVIDLPGVSSSYRQVENKALQSLVFANGVVWVANAKDGGLTGSDIEYLRKHVPQETPKLVVLTHLDLLPPSGISQVVNKTQASITNIPTVVGVVGTSKGQSLTTNPETRLYWDRLVSESHKNRRVKPLLRDVVQVLEGLIPSVDQEVAESVNEYLVTVGASKEDYDRFLETLFAHCKNAIFEMNTLVDRKRPLVGYHIDLESLHKHMEESLEYCENLTGKVVDGINEKAERISDEAPRGIEPLLRMILYWYEAACFASQTLLGGVWIASSLLCWRFHEPFEDGELARALEEIWEWDVLRHMFQELYSTAVDQIVNALREFHPLYSLYKQGQQLLECEDLDQIG